MKGKKGFNLSSLLPIAMVFVVTGIAVAYGLQVLGDVSGDMCTYERDGLNCLNATGGTAGAVNSEGFNATVSTILAVSKFPAKFGLLITIVIAAIVLMILVRYLAGNR